jgi:uncharacterized phage protein gp47/JayE
MTNYIDANGLNLETITEIFDGLVSSFQTIYGVDINVEANSPDGQMIGLFSLAKADILDCIAQVYNSFSPSNTSGVTLSQRCALNGVIRNGATYTRTEVIITTDGAVDLVGLDDDETNPFTVADDAGNQYQLEESVTTTDGMNTLVFRAKEAGAIQVLVNHITIVVTVTLNVLSANNPNSPTTDGIDEESDTELRARREASVSLPSQGYLSGLAGALANLENVADVKVYENYTDSEDGYGIPARSIWAIVDCPDTEDDLAAVADTIYRKRSLGCGMKGSESVDITEVSGETFEVNFDLAAEEDLYIQLVLQSSDGNHILDVDPDSPTSILNQLYAKLSYKINEQANISDIIAYIKDIDAYAIVRIDEGGGVSLTSSNYDAFVSPSSIQSRFKANVANMDITAV